MQPVEGGLRGFCVRHRYGGGWRFGEDLGSVLAELQLQARDLKRGQLVVGGLSSQRLAFGERGQRHLDFELNCVATACAF